MCHVEEIQSDKTLCGQANEASGVANSGATLCSPVSGRLDDFGKGGMALVRDIA